jgi:ABC-type antimicrobial peptide transport system permease subunit
MVARRTREFGIRIALGASPARVMRGVLAGALRVVAVGGVAGSIGAVATTRIVASLLYDVSAADTTVVVGAVAAMLTATLTASLLPARRASRVDPIVALRVD